MYVPVRLPTFLSARVYVYRYTFIICGRSYITVSESFDGIECLLVEGWVHTTKGHKTPGTQSYRGVVNDESQAKERPR